MKQLLSEKLSSWRMSGFMIGMVIYYSTLFCVGLFGNFWVIGVLIFIIKNLRLTFNQNVFIYILCLSFVDSLVIMFLPILLSDMILFHWIFGESFCKFYIMIESVNKMLSTFILAMLSFDRYLAVCRPNDSSKMRSSITTIIIVLILLAVVCILLTPVYLFAQEIIVDEYVILNNYTFTIGVPKCTLNMNHDLIITFTVYIFVIGFCLPTLVIIYFYSKVLFFIFNHTKSLSCRRSQIPVKRITCATFMIILFYFACWMPYWVTTLLGAFVFDDTTLGPSLAKILFIVHSLVYINSSFNWVFYAFLNNHLRESHEIAVWKKRSRNLASWLPHLPRMERYDIELEVLRS